MEWIRVWFNSEGRLQQEQVLHGSLKGAGLLLVEAVYDMIAILWPEVKPHCSHIPPKDIILSTLRTRKTRDASFARKSRCTRQLSKSQIPNRQIVIDPKHNAGTFHKSFFHRKWHVEVPNFASMRLQVPHAFTFSSSQVPTILTQNIYSRGLRILDRSGPKHSTSLYPNIFICL